MRLCIPLLPVFALLCVLASDGPRLSAQSPAPLVWSFEGTNTNVDGSVTQERFTLRYAPDLVSATVRSEHSKDGLTWYERLTGTYTKLSAMPRGF